MARTLNQILAELKPTFKPQIQSVRQRQALLPGQIETEEKALGAKQEQAFGDILSGARRRGLGFSGIPLSEQAEYTSTEFLPALARLRQSGREAAISLEDAILGIRERRDTLAQQIRQQELDRREARRQAQLQAQLERERIAASERSARSSGGGGGGFAPTFGDFWSLGGSGGGGGARYTETSPGSFAFTNAAGKPITAAQYAQATGRDIRSVLKMMGEAGDVDAARMYSSLRNMGKNSPLLAKQLQHYRKKFPHIWRT